MAKPRPGKRTYQEIEDQAGLALRTWERFQHGAFAGFQEAWKECEPELVTFAGCGTSHYTARILAALTQQATGITTAAVPGSELLAPGRDSWKRKHHLMVLISASGETTEMVEAAKRVSAYAGEAGGPVITAMSCDQSSLTRQVKAAITLDTPREQSVVMTRSFTAMVYGFQLVLSWVTGTQHKLASVPANLEARLPLADHWAQETASQVTKRLIFLGSGPLWPLADEAKLKVLEMTQLWCDAYQTLEFRHGPMSLVDAGTTVVLFSTDASKEADQQLAADVRANGGQVRMLNGAAMNQLAETAGPGAGILSMPPDEGDGLTLFVPFVHMLGYYLAVNRGKDPDQPRNLSHVVTI